MTYGEIDVPKITEPCCGNCRYMLPAKKNKDGLYPRFKGMAKQIECYWMCTRGEKDIPRIATQKCADFENRYDSEDVFKKWLEDCHSRNNPQKKKREQIRERNKAMYKEFMEGKSINQISEHYNLSKCRVYDILSEYISLDPQRGALKPLSYTPISAGRCICAADKEWIWQRYKEGYTQREIAAAVNRTQGAISWIVREKRREANEKEKELAKAFI